MTSNNKELTERPWKALPMKEPDENPRHTKYTMMIIPCILAIVVLLMVFVIIPYMNEQNNIPTYADKGNCKWGKSGNACISAGVYLDWCISNAVKNPSIKNSLAWCTDLMSPQQSPVIHPSVEFRDKNGTMIGKIECGHIMQTYKNYSIGCDDKGIIAHLPPEFRINYTGYFPR